MYVNVKSAYGVVGNGIVDDTNKIQLAINDLYSKGGGTLFFPAGTYLIASKTGSVLIPTSDDGTVKEGFGQSKEPEPVYSLGYSIRVRPGVRLVGDSAKCVTFKGKYNFGDADLNQLIMFAFDEPTATSLERTGLEDVTVTNTFMAFAALDQTLTLCTFKELVFKQTAICIYAQVLERCTFDELYVAGCGTMLVVGGQWKTRNDEYNEKGGFADKCYFNKISYVYQRSVGSKEQAIDAFFDTYFFKTENNLTRLSTPIGASSIATLLKYRGICGTAINILPRYGRPSNNNDFSNFFYGFSYRYVVYSGNMRSCRFSNVNIERCGFQNSSNKTGEIGGSFKDPYLRDGERIPSFFVGTSTACSMNQIQAQECYAKQIIPDGCFYTGLDVSGNTDLLTDQAPSSYTIQENVKVPYQFTGEKILKSASSVNGICATSIQLPLNKTYLLRVWYKVQGTPDNSRLKVCLVNTYVGNSNTNFSILSTTVLGEEFYTSSGPVSPTLVAVEKPDQTGTVAISCKSNFTVIFDVSINVLS